MIVWKDIGKFVQAPKVMVHFGTSKILTANGSELWLKCPQLVAVANQLWIHPGKSKNNTQGIKKFQKAV